MKEARCLLVLIFLVLTIPLFAKGKTDEAAAKTQNDEWFLCIAKFDTSALPADKLNISDVVLRALTDSLKSINYHTRISPEYAYYEDYAWARARATAAKTLSTKIDERSKQIYMGEPNWKYRQNIVKIDNEIKKLRENLEEIDKNAPLINKEPVFKLTSSTLNLTFPDAPEKKGENRFCITQKADAFLSGSITDFHGRYLLKVKLYTVYTKTFVWEDSVIFSYSDIDDAIDEITRKLIIVLSGNRPAAVAVKAEPETTLVLINRSFAGKGESPLTEYPPGKITVNASAPDHESIVLETELVSGELTDINIKLNPIKYVNADILGDGRNKIYHGALYVGEAPLTLRFPVNNLEYIEMENFNGKKGSIVFRTQDSSEYEQSVSIKTILPLKKGRVDKERRDYYWGWGSQWITGIATWVFYYSFLGARDAYDSSGTPELEERMTTMYYLSTGALVAFGVASAYGIYRMIRYIYYSGRDSASIAPQGGKK